jgi:hypothetical protein
MGKRKGKKRNGLDLGSWIYKLIIKMERRKGEKFIIKTGRGAKKLIIKMGLRMDWIYCGIEMGIENIKNVIKMEKKLGNTLVSIEMEK